MGQLTKKGRTLRTHNSAHTAHATHAPHEARRGRVESAQRPKEAAYALRALSGSGVALPGGSCRAAPSRELARYSRGSVVALSGGSCRAAPPRELARYSRGMYGYPRLERASRQRRSVCRTAPTAKPPQQNQCSHWSAAWVGRHSEANVLGGALETLSGSTAALLWGPAGRRARACGHRGLGMASPAAVRTPTSDRAALPTAAPTARGPTARAPRRARAERACPFAVPR